MLCLEIVHADKIAQRVVLLVDGIVVSIAELGVSSLFYPVQALKSWLVRIAQGEVRPKCKRDF